MKRDQEAVQFTYERTLKLRRPKFRLSPSIEYLDPAKLSKGSHTLELGKFEGCGCDCAVIAKVKNGLVTGFNYPKCKNTRPIPPQVARKILAARKKLMKNAPSKWEDIPVGDIVSGTAVARLTTVIREGECIMVCWDEGQGEKCVICCFKEKSHHCMDQEPLLVRF